mgnify:CR=1 FL=1|tara:strand:+ start:1397 stop:2125 length:729 start_codon:yes stop_codon:yes gene_type:complete
MSKPKMLFIGERTSEDVDEDKYDFLEIVKNFYIPFSKIPSKSEIIQTSISQLEDIYSSGRYGRYFPLKLVKDKLEKLSSKEIRTIFSSNVLDMKEFKKYKDKLLVDEKRYGVYYNKIKKRFLKKESDVLDKKQFGDVIEHKADKQEKFDLDNLFKAEIKVGQKKEEKLDDKLQEARGFLETVAERAKDIQTPQTLSSKIESESGLPVTRRKELREMVKKNGFKLNQLTKKAQMLVRISRGEK